jgi:DNA-binding response OmpR family regulator
MKKVILAVDDDSTALGALRQILVQRGYDVATARNGDEALTWLSGRIPDLILLDVSMPGLSGYDVCRKIREDPRTAATPVVFLTAKGMHADVVEAQSAGSDLYLVKPVLATKLITRVEMFLSKDGALARKRSTTSSA